MDRPLAAAVTVLARRLRTAMERWGPKTAAWLGRATGTARHTDPLATDRIEMQLMSAVCARLKVCDTIVMDLSPVRLTNEIKCGVPGGETAHCQLCINGAGGLTLWTAMQAPADPGGAPQAAQPPCHPIAAAPRPGAIPGDQLSGDGPRLAMSPQPARMHGAQGRLTNLPVLRAGPWEPLCPHPQSLHESQRD